MLHRTLPILAAVAVAASAAAPGAATASSSFHGCGASASHGRFHIQARGVGCTTAKTVGKLVSQHVKVLRPMVFEYKAGKYTCRYTVFSSTKAGDGEGEIFDCKAPGKEVRWSNSDGILPHSIAP